MFNRPILTSILLFMLVVEATAPAAGADCGPCDYGWGPDFGMPADFHAYASIVFDDGTGPALYVGGEYLSLYQPNEYFGAVARWDGSGWSHVGDGLEGAVYALAAADLGDGLQLYAGGRGLSTPDGFENTGLMRWNGTDWINEYRFQGNVTVFALAVGGTADQPLLYAGGSFTSLYWQLNIRNIAAFDGSNVSSVGGYYGANDDVLALAVCDLGEGSALYAAGEFTSIGGNPAKRIARWNGWQWSGLGEGADDEVYALTCHDDGSGAALFVGGRFEHVGGQPINYVAKWDGAQWSQLDDGLTGFPGAAVHAFTVFDAGAGPALFAGGRFSEAGGNSSFNIAGWNGQEWLAVTPPYDWGSRIRALSVFDAGFGPKLYAVGEESFPSRWDGQRWSLMGGAVGSDQPDSESFTVRALAPGAPSLDAMLYAGGNFEYAGGSSAWHLAGWDGEGWHALGESPNGWIHALAQWDDGSCPALYAGGYFTQIGSAPFNHVARWDGKQWQALGNGLNNRVRALAALNGPEPALYAGGSFVKHIKKWNGSSWSAGIGGGTNGDVWALALDTSGPNLKLFAGGEFTMAGGVNCNRIARWNGEEWHALGDGTNDLVRAVVKYDDGSGSALYVAGRFTMVDGQPANYIAKWHNAEWSPLGEGLGPIITWPEAGGHALAVVDMGNGPVLAIGGYFSTAGDLPAYSIATWDSQQWSKMDAGIRGLYGQESQGLVKTLLSMNGAAGQELFVGGNFLWAGDQASVRMARWRCVLRGDFTNDNVIDSEDIAFFVNVLLDPEYAAPDELSAADINCDGVADGDDIQMFLNLIL